MKKLFIIFLSLFLFIPFTMGEYIPIEKSKSEAYRKEITQSINSQIPIRKKEIIDVFDEVEKEQNQYEKDSIITQGTDSVLFNFYCELIDITEKYVGKDKIYDTMDGSDDIMELDRELRPYLKDNKINVSKMNSFLKFTSKEQRKLEKKYSYPYKQWQEHLFFEFYINKCRNFILNYKK